MVKSVQVRIQFGMLFKIVTAIHRYNRDVSCQWSFAIKHGKMKLFRIYVEYFDMELSPDCHYDGVRVSGSARAERYTFMRHHNDKRKFVSLIQTDLDL